MAVKFKFPKLRKNPRKFPSWPNVANQARRDPDVTWNEDGECSSPRLTEWYVAAYCNLNGLYFVGTPRASAGTPPPASPRR